MMIKYRVHDVAKDLDVPNKEVLDILGKYVKEPKKHMTALEENELDIVFDRFTQDHAAQNFDAYFATRNAAKTEEKPAEKTAEKPSEKTAKNTQEPKKQNVNNNNNRNKNNDRRNNNGNNRNQNAQQNKPQRPAQNNQPSNNTPAQEAASEAPRRRVVDTRTVNVNIDKYNEKYDRLAYDKVKNDTVAAKQKINQKSQRRGKPRSAKRETEAERLNRIAAERKAKAITITVPDEITVGEFALRLKATSAEVIKKLMANGVFATINDTIDFDTAVLIADEFHAKVEKEVVVTIEDRIIDDSEDDDANLVPRAPVVVVMGHVDHGKTSILDAIRHANVTAGEAGGITQHIGAYRVNIDGKDITFLDTPGHAAFTTMRARGAMVTDIAVLVVAADDGIMPQTVEAINHAKAAGVSIIVAINKMDKPAANPDLVKQQLTEYELVPEEWGGDVPCIPVSAHTKMGIDDLLEMILLVAEMKELKANPDRAAKGTVIEARLDTFNAVSDERLARELVEQRLTEQKEEMFNSQTKVTLDNLFEQMKEGEMKELKVIVKADVQGSVEAVRQSLEKLSNDEVRVHVIHGAVGAISESDVMLANASNAIIVGFNVRPDPVAEENAKRDGVDMRLYRIIYDCIEEIESAMKGMLAPKYREVFLGKAECREVYKITNVGMVIGGHVTSGKIVRGAQVRLVRDGIIVADDKIASLRRFKDDVKEVQDGYDCGITLERFSDIKLGDILEAYEMEEYRD